MIGTENDIKIIIFFIFPINTFFLNIKINIPLNYLKYYRFNIPNIL